MLRAGQPIVLLTFVAALGHLAVGCNYFERRGLRAVREQSEARARGNREADARTSGRTATRIRVPEESHPLEALGFSREEIRAEGLDDLRRGDYAVSIGETLIYPTQWLRAESVAETLRPLLESYYGPNVRVIPHPDTNQLLIYVPPYGEWTRGSSRNTLPGTPRSTPGVSTPR